MISSSLLLSLTLASRPAFCTAPIIVTEARNPIAYYDYRKNDIVLSTQLKRYEVKHAVNHECGHAAEDEHNIDIPDYFGKPPFVTEYAATNKHEDFAETIAFELEGHRVEGKKGIFARRLIRKLSR